MELRADPHRVGVDQFLADVGSAVAAYVGLNCAHLRSFDFRYQCLGVVQADELIGAVCFFVAGRPVQIIQ